MFDSLSHSDLVGALSATMRAAAKDATGDTGPDEFVRVQWLSGSSIARYLAEELRYLPALTGRFVETVTAELAEPPAGTDPATAVAFAGAAERIRAQPRPDRIGAVLAELLADCSARRREHGTEPGPAERLLRRRLRELADDQVTLLIGHDPLDVTPNANGAHR